jgi:hypothetical protein
MRNRTLIIFILLMLPFYLSGQKQVNSPYSRFNIGTLEPAGPFRSLGMGGIGTSMRDNVSVYYTNPASYSAFDTTSFIFDFGVDYAINRISSPGSDYKSQDLDFNHLLLGFPLAKGWGLVSGIVPISNGYYDLSQKFTSEDPGYNPVIGGYTSSHSGSGGLSNFFIGTGLMLHKYISAGVNMNVIFGQINRSNQTRFDDIYNSYHDNSRELLKLKGINFDFGLQFMYPMKNGTFVNAGVSYTATKSYRSDYEKFVYRYTAMGTTDTISYSAAAAEPVKIPGTVRAGISFGKINKLTAGFDFIATNWSQSRIPESSEYVADTRSYILGLEYTPDRFSNFGLFNRISYRIGGHTGSNYLKINGEQLKDAGISAGLGIPMRRGRSMTNLYFDFTHRYGQTLHTENLYSFGISLNLYDYWFIKRKYD